MKLAKLVKVINITNALIVIQIMILILLINSASVKTHFTTLMPIQILFLVNFVSQIVLLVLENLNFSAYLAMKIETTFYHQIINAFVRQKIILFKEMDFFQNA